MDDGTLSLIHRALTVPSLKQHALAKLAETLITRDQKDFTFIITKQKKAPGENWHQRWMQFKTNVSNGIQQLLIPNCLNDDLRATTICLCDTAWAFANSEIFIPAIPLKFNARGDVDAHRMFENYMERTLRVPRLPRKKKYDLLRDACYIFHDRCVQLMLCKLLLWQRSELIPSLRDSRRVVEVGKFGENWRCDISFVLDHVVNRNLWVTFVTALNNRGFDNIEFSFEQNVLKVLTTSENGNASFDKKLLWPKMTTAQKCEYAKPFFKASVYIPDARFLIDTLRHMDYPERMDTVKSNLALFLLFFLSHPYDRHFLPDLQLVDEDLQVVQREDQVYYIFGLIDEVILEEELTSNLLSSLVQLRRYVLSRNNLIADHVLLNMREVLEQWIPPEYIPWFCAGHSSDVTNAISKLHGLFLT